MKVYCLYELKTLKIRYIGITSQDLKIRLYQHFYHKNKNFYKENWIIKNNKEIGIKLIKECISKEIARTLELTLIRKYKDSHKLVNLQDRGYCGDKIIMSKEKCKRISKTLKYKYKNNILKIQGEKEVYVWDNRGNLILNFKNTKECSRFLNIGSSKICGICIRGGYYTKYTFTRDPILPIERYFKCYDSLKGELKLCFKKEDIKKVLEIEKFHNINIDKNRFYLNRYIVLTNNKFPPLLNGNIVCNGISYNSLNSVMYSSKSVIHTWIGDIRENLKKNTIFKRNSIQIQNEICAWYKFGELLETPEGFKTKEEVEILDLNV